MKTKLLCILSALTLAMSSVSGVLAAEINMSTKAVVVEGEFEGALKGTRYLAKVFNPGVKGNTGDYSETEWYSYIHQDTIGDGGEYIFDYTLSENSEDGKYEIEIILEDGTVKTDEFYYFTDEYADAVAKTVTTPEGATDEIKLSNLLANLEDAETRECLNANFELYDSLEDKEKAAGILFEMGTIETRAEFKEAFAGITAAIAIEEADASEVPDILAEVAAEIGLEDISTYKEYAKGESGIDSRLVSCGAENATELKERLSYFLIKEELAAVENWQLVQPTLEKYNDVLEIDFSEYESSDDKYDIIEAFLKAECDTVEEIADAFDTAETESTSKPDNDDNDNKVNNVTSNNRHENSSNTSGNKNNNGSSIIIEKNASAPVVTPADEPEVSMPDVPDSHWAKAYITELHSRGVVSGDENGNIRPDSDITREEFVKIMVAGLGIADAESYVPFDDVPESSWSSRYIQAARENQLVTGTTDGRFMPGEPIARQDLFVILGRYLVGAEELQNTPFGFSDEDDADDYAKAYIAYLGREGLVTGFSDGTVRPFEKCTRAEAFAMLCRVIELSE